jgi:hypothetical protein
VFNEDGSVNWRFETIYDHFELFLGMTMASFATADKLSRAISINRDRNMFASEDGTFLVDMLISFIDLSICKAGEFPPIQEGNFSTLSVEIGPLSNFVCPQGGKNICEVLSGLKTILLNVVSDLEAGSEYEMILESELAVRTADDLLAASMIFTDFIHPVWNRIHRTGFFDLIFLERWKIRLGVSICLDVISIEISISTPKKYQSRRSRKSRRFSKVSLDDREISVEIEISRFSLDELSQGLTF